jgi:hypothetical protein
LTVDFVVCTHAVKKKNQGRFRPVGSDHSLVRVTNRFPTPSSLKQLDVLQEEWYRIPLETVQNWYEFSTVLKEKCGNAVLIKKCVRYL